MLEADNIAAVSCDFREQSWTTYHNAFRFNRQVENDAGDGDEDDGDEDDGDEDDGDEDDGEKTELEDFVTQLMFLEKQNKKRLFMARQVKDSMAQPTNSAR